MCPSMTQHACQHLLKLVLKSGGCLRAKRRNHPAINSPITLLIQLVIEDKRMSAVRLVDDLCSPAQAPKLPCPRIRYDRPTRRRCITCHSRAMLEDETP